MARQSAPAGTYILTGVQWSRRQDDGSFITYEEGDEVELDATEASRLMGGPIQSFVLKENPSDSTDDSTKRSQAGASGVPEFRDMKE